MKVNARAARTVGEPPGWPSDPAGKVTVAGAHNAHVPEMLGWKRAGSLSEAIAMAKSAVGPSPEITMMHHPPNVMADTE